MRLNFIIALILSIVVASFAIVNSKVVAINLLFSTVSVSQALVIFISVAVGAIIALLFGLVKEFKLKRDLKDSKQQIKELEKENKQLKEELQEGQDGFNNRNITDSYSEQQEADQELNKSTVDKTNKGGDKDDS
ncbi:MAG: LapA family protein [Bacillota bacterium]